MIRSVREAEVGIRLKVPGIVPGAGRAGLAGYPWGSGGY